jgi:parvulin-like peptidyl-prolyl isomerase
MAQTYSMGGEAVTKGDLGWVAIGGMIPEIEEEIAKHKTGEIFKVYTSGGVHLIRKTDTKQDTGFALILRIFL